MPSDGATFPRLHVWSNNETILPVDLNAEFNNVLNNFSFEGLDDYELNVTQMRLQTTPGGVGTESLATSGAGELERIRFVLARAFGTTYWYEGPPVSLTQANILLAQAVQLPGSRLDSGAALPFLPRLTAPGAVILNGSVTAFQFHIAGLPYTVNTSVTFAGLTLGSASAASQALVNDTTLTAQESSKTRGENGTVITIDGVGANILGRVGTVSAFRVVHAGNTEYFLATPLSATTLGHALRGYFYDAAGLPIPRIAIADEDVITLMSLAYVFIKSDLTLATTYNAPTYSGTQPSVASNGDYWFDQSVGLWKTFNGSAWVLADATFLGLAIQDSVKTVGTRMADFFAGYSSANTIVPVFQDSTTIVGASIGELVSVAGHTFSWPTSVPVWSSIGQFAPGSSLLPLTTYYLYVTDTGALLLDTIAPYDRTADLGGFYHPNNLWRAVGIVSTDAGSLFVNGSFSLSSPPQIAASGGVPSGMIGPFGGATAPVGYLLCDGTSYSRSAYPSLFAAIGTAWGTADGSHFNVPDLRDQFLRGVFAGSGQTARTALNPGGNAGNLVGSAQIGSTKLPNTVFTLGTESATHFHGAFTKGNTLAAGDVPGAVNLPPKGDNGGSFGNPQTGTESATHTHAFTGGGDAETRPANAYVTYVIKT